MTKQTVRPEAGTASAKADRSETSARLLAVVRELASELQPRKEAKLVVQLDSDLDRDLGLDSLGRAELLHRLDRAFGVRLPEQLIIDAVTPQVGQRNANATDTRTKTALKP